MAAPGDSRGQAGLVVEYLFAAAILAALIVLIRFVVVNGYFPDPFFNDTTDTFMDWYNTAYWAHHGGAFEFWGSVYPPAALFFAKVFSIKACYAVSSEVGRSCDRTGVTLLSSLLVANTILTYRVLRRAGVPGALPRAAALGFGAPILLAWERGNEIVPCYTVFILAYGRLLRSGWLRMLCAALTVNFKPYLIVLAVVPLIKRRWRWLEGFGVCLAVVYALGYFAMGEGDPIHLLQDIGGFSETSPNPPINILRFAVTYRELLQIINSDYPLMYFIGSRPMELANTVFPPLMQLGGLGALACLGAAGVRRDALTANTLAALTMCLLFTANGLGGYALDFLLFFVFVEHRRGVLGAVVVICAYLWCIPADIPVATLTHQAIRSYISGRLVFYDLHLTVGQFVRPAIFLVMEYALIATSLLQIARRVSGPHVSPRTPRPDAASVGLEPA